MGPYDHPLLTAMLNADVVVDLARGLRVVLHASLMKLAALLVAAIRGVYRAERRQIGAHEQHAADLHKKKYPIVPA